MTILSAIIDTNVLIAALRSNQGASYRLLQLLGQGRFQIHLSVPLVLEYEDVVYRMIDTINLKREDIDAILDYMCAVAYHQKIFYLWRPFLRDPKDDMVLELAVAAQCPRIITFNERDFRGVDQFGIDVIRPQAFLALIGGV